MIDKNSFSIMRWMLIMIYLGITIISAFCKSSFIIQISPLITVLSIFTIVCLHGTVLYGLKNIIIFFIITWIVSNFFEALSIQTGFPFGFYYYDKLIGPRLFEVPLIIMFAYFSAGYSSWILSHVVLEQYNKKPTGTQLILIPLVAAFIMVMWDLCMDPLCSTVASLWVWNDGGMYFGVPLQNYFGWFLVVYIIYQIFILYLRKHPVSAINTNKFFWLEIVAVYGILALTQLLQFWGAQSHQNIYASMALITVFTMLFVTLVSFLRIKESKQLN
ncbi:MAG: carotenoid biosynthesis protein [Legionella sp.]|nr:carotenoid biosynthesis protein [Legionella sp.]